MSGDDHLHVNMMPKTEPHFRAAKALLLKFAEQAVALRGTVGAERGVGKSKAHLLKLLYPPQVPEAIWRIKLALDPLQRRRGQQLLRNGRRRAIPDGSVSLPEPTNSMLYVLAACPGRKVPTRM